MSNAEHYALEARLATRLGEMDVNELRSALIRFIVESPVNSVRNLALHLDVPLRTPEVAGAE